MVSDSCREYSFRRFREIITPTLGIFHVGPLSAGVPRERSVWQATGMGLSEAMLVRERRFFGHTLILGLHTLADKRVSVGWPRGSAERSDLTVAQRENGSGAHVDHTCPRWLPMKPVEPDGTDTGSCSAPECPDERRCRAILQGTQAIRGARHCEGRTVARIGAQVAVGGIGRLAVGKHPPFWLLSIVTVGRLSAALCLSWLELA